MALNFAWEAAATVSYHEYVGIVWCLVDTVIVYYIIREYSTRKKNIIIYALTFLTCFIICLLFFETPFFGVRGFVFICFAIDLIMAAEFVFEFCFGRIETNRISLGVAIFRTIGDYFAWILYRNELPILAIGFSVLVLNLLYLTFVGVRLAGLDISRKNQNAKMLKGSESHTSASKNNKKNNPDKRRKKDRK